jgi:hypothetical protein
MDTLPDGSMPVKTFNIPYDSNADLSVFDEPDTIAITLTRSDGVVFWTSCRALWSAGVAPSDAVHFCQKAAGRDVDGEKRFRLMHQAVCGMIALEGVSISHPLLDGACAGRA